MRRGFLVVLLLALALRGLLFAGILCRRGPDGFFQPDSPGYWALGRNLAAGRGFSRQTAPPYVPDSVRTPAYPFLLAGLSWLEASPTAAVLAQILLSSLTCLLAARVVTAWGGDRRAALLAAVALALDLPSVLAANLIMTETLCALIVTLGIVCATRAVTESKTAWAAAAGACSALAVLCRPAAILLPLAWLPLFRGRRLAVFLSACILTLAPWLVRNALVFGTPFLSTVSSVNLLRCKAAGALARAEGIPIEKAADRLEAGIPRGLSPLADARAREAAAWRVLRAHPLEAFRTQLSGLDRLLLRPERRGFDLALGLAPDGGTSRLTMALCAFQTLLLAGVWIGFAWGTQGLWASGNRTLVWLLVSGILAFTLTASGPEAYARFRVPIMPFLAVGAGLGAAGLARSKEV